MDYLTRRNGIHATIEQLDPHPVPSAHKFPRYVGSLDVKGSSDFLLSQAGLAQLYGPAAVL